MFIVVYNYDFNFNLEGMGLVLGQSWMVVLIIGRILFSPPIIMYCEICCCLHILSVVNVLVKGLELGQCLMLMGILLYVPFIMYYGSSMLLFTR